MTQKDSGRSHIIESLRRELLGPDPSERLIELEDGMRLDKYGDLFGPWSDKETGEEILCVNSAQENPTKRYGLGVLYSKKRLSNLKEEEKEEEKEALDVEDDYSDDETQSRKKSSAEDFDQIKKRADRKGDYDSALEDDLQGIHQNKASALALTFCFDSSRSGDLEVEVEGGRYKKFRVIAPNKDADKDEGYVGIWWLRKPVNQQVDWGVPVEDGDEPVRLKRQDEDDLDLTLRIIKRKNFLTICLVNQESEKRGTEANLFQAKMTVRCLDKNGFSMIKPYSDGQKRVSDPETKAMDLLLRNRKKFAVGHGCSVDWEEDEENKVASSVSTVFLPEVELKNLTYKIFPGQEGPSFDMHSLSGWDRKSDGLAQLDKLIDHYHSWIKRKTEEARDLKVYAEAAKMHLKQCSEALERMKQGRELLTSDPEVLQAFKWANEAMWRQQLRGKKDRSVVWNEKTGQYGYPVPYPDENTSPDPGQAVWRPFQIGFILMCLSSLADKKGSQRRLVDLLWFPTGGGKTEAYLGLAAFSMLLRRIRNREDQGLDVFSRYTLRLLTTQQFQRSARLICALEYIRRKDNNEQTLGETPFSIGLWVGQSVTPNKVDVAIGELKGLNMKQYARDWLVLRRCPWCNAEMGVIPESSDWPLNKKKKYNGKYVKPPDVKFLGYEQWQDEVRVHCPAHDCSFHDELPVVLIDEEIYKNPPTMLIATVDKFASLAWNPDIRSLFGLDDEGKRINAPPTLIIQDELHLISGPLGSMTGMFESVVEELCSEREGDVITIPKIICATATIKGFKEQVKNLFGRTTSSVFPSPGLEIEDSFWSREDKETQGKIYVGVHAPAHGSIQTSQVRCFAALLHAPMKFSREVPRPNSSDENNRDPWWTIASFYTSLKELGHGLTLLQSDVPDRLKMLSSRYGLGPGEYRKISFRVTELTSRLRNEEIPVAIEKLEKTADQSDAIDVVLASSIIEVGVDIDRLSLMTVIGSPKTVSTYLQATGRVGRRPGRPGLIVSIFNFLRPRDRSLYENFRSYHEHMYAGVEATSVTPYSIPALERCLHAAIVAYVRQAGAKEQVKTPVNIPPDLCDNFRKILLSRVDQASPEDLPQVEEWFDQRMDEWQRYGHEVWENYKFEGDTPLLRAAGQYTPEAWEDISWSTQWSMRNVDAECRVKISDEYHKARKNNE